MIREVTIKSIIESYENMRSEIKRSKDNILTCARMGKFEEVDKLSEALAEYESYITRYLYKKVKIKEDVFHG